MSSTKTPPVWLITGSSAGFGRHLAEQALGRGDIVVATARRPETVEDLVARTPERALALPLDVTRTDHIDAAVAATLERFGRIDVLVNNAGYGSVGAVEEIATDDLRALMEVMFFGAVALTQAVLPHMRRQGSGVIVQMSSMGGQVSPPGFGAYCSAKFALEAMSDALAQEADPLGIRVLIVEPGSFRTEFAGTRMHHSAAIGAYAQTVGPTRAFMEGIDGVQPGDPAKAAAAVLAAVDAPDAPRRLALGADAVDAIRGQHERLARDLDAWEHVSRATAVDPAAA